MTPQEQTAIEPLYSPPYWVIDFLPRRVPPDCGGQFFAVEAYFRSATRLAAFRRRIADVLLKLACYYSLRVSGGIDAPMVHNPPPGTLYGWIAHPADTVTVLVEAEHALITLDRDDLYATVYHPSEDLLCLLSQLAAANGLFVRQGAGQADGES